MPDEIYVPRVGASLLVPWPEDGRPIDPLSNIERRLVLEGDLILKLETPAPAPKKGQSGDTGGEQS